MNDIPSNCIVTKLDRQQMQGNDVMSLLYFDINLYRFISKYNKLIISFPCICCLSSLVTMQLLGIAFILYLIHLPQASLKNEKDRISCTLFEG